MRVIYKQENPILGKTAHAPTTRFPRGMTLRVMVALAALAFVLAVANGILR